MAHVSRDLLWQILGETTHFHGVQQQFQHTAELGASGFTDEHDWHCGMNLFVFLDRVKVDVSNPTLEVVMLHFLNECELLNSVDLEVDQNVVRSAAKDHLGEGLGVHLDVLVVLTLAINHGGDGASLAKAVDWAAANGGAEGSGDVDNVSHGPWLSEFKGGKRG